MPVALALLTLLRLVVAAVTPLAPDEAYYWVWSRALASGYLDHPPMVAGWIWLGTALLGDGALGVRLLGPLSGLVGAWLLAATAGDVCGDRRLGARAALLLNATLLLGIGTVTMTPDTPLIFFWTLGVFGCGRLLATGDGRWWGLIGLASGLALDSKYTGVLLPVGVLLWLVWVPGLRPWLRRPQPWLAAALALALFAPVLAWNAGHDWVSFAKQGGRTGDWQPGRAAQFLGELLAGQIGLATPVLAGLFGLGLWQVAKQGWRREPGGSLLAILAWLPLLVFAQHALGDRVQANWPAILYPTAALAAAGLGRRWQLPGVALGLGLTGLVWVQASLAPLALPMRADPTLLRLGGWEQLAGEIEAVRRAAGADYVVADNYGHAALLARLLPGVVLGLDDRWALFALPDARAQMVGKVGVLVRSARRDEAPDLRDWAEVTPLGSRERARNGMVAEGFRLYRVIGRVGDAPLAVMPHPR